MSAFFGSVLLALCACSAPRQQPTAQTPSEGPRTAPGEVERARAQVEQAKARVEAARARVEEASRRLSEQAAALERLARDLEQRTRSEVRSLLGPDLVD